MEDTLVVFATYREPVQASLVKGKLESEGLESFLQDENIVRINWLYSGAVGGVKLLVWKSDLERVAEVLDMPLHPPEPGGLKCPECGSTRVGTEVNRKFSAWLNLILLGLPSFWVSRRYRCWSCHQIWR